MAYTASPLLLLALMVVATASVAHCQLNVGGFNVAQISVTGIVQCQVTTPSTTAAPISGASVSLTCGPGTTTLATAVTNPLGVATMLVNAADAVVFNPATCFVTARLPVGTCTVSPPTGLLRSALSFVNVATTNQNSVANFLFAILA